MKKPSLLVILMTFFIDLVGFGIVMPILPVYTENFGARGLMIGWVMASYSLMQMLFSPFWGRLSDRVGRRPILLLSTAGAAVSYWMFAKASAMTGSTGLWMVIGSRMLAGICAANMAVASAYIADITPKEKRSARMGLVGMAIGFGFIFGPIIGAVSYDRFGITGPGWAAGILCSVNFVMAFIFLKESRTEEADTPSAVKPSIGWLQVLRRPVTGFMIILSFAVTVCFACFEVTFSRMMVNYREYGISQISYLFAFCAFISAMVQGGMIGRLVKRYGEGRLIVVSCFLYSASMFWLPIAGGMVALVLALGLLGLGSGMNRPPTFGLISIMTSESEQGAVMGVAQGAGSLARIVGPLLAGVLYDVDHRAPYFLCGLIAFVAGICAAVYLEKKQSYIQERMPQSST